MTTRFAMATTTTTTTTAATTEALLRFRRRIQIDDNRPTLIFDVVDQFLRRQIKHFVYAIIMRVQIALAWEVVCVLLGRDESSICEPIEIASDWVRKLVSLTHGTQRASTKVGGVASVVLQGIHRVRRCQLDCDWGLCPEHFAPDSLPVLGVLGIGSIGSPTLEPKRVPRLPCSSLGLFFCHVHCASSALLPNESTLFRQRELRRS